MDITKHNFEEQFENIKKAIEESTFLAIDGEFTGLSDGKESKICSFDTPADRYKKLVKIIAFSMPGGSDFLLIQFGLCAFKAIEEEQRYEAKPFNFYIFPRPFNYQSPDRRFLCQSSSIDFLMSHDFDFNKLFKEGIPYLNYEQEVKLKEKQAERNNPLFFSPTSAATKKFVVPPEHKEFINDIREKIDTYLKSGEAQPLSLPPCDAFRRKMIYRALEQDYPLLGLSTKTGEKKERFLQVSRNETAADKEKKREERERMEVDLQVGFSKVMKLVTESGKLVVGHNMYLDVIHSFNHFYGAAPQELEEFKEAITSVFPQLLDTKLVANTLPFKEQFLGTSLEELKVTMKLPPFKEAQIELPEGFTRYGDGCGAYHEAGYDAFVTGSCFASMVNFLGRYQTPNISFLLPSHAAVQPFVNKLYMMRIADIPYVNLAGPDVEPPRDNVFHVTFPEEWRSSDLYQLFEPYGHVQLSWLTSTTAYVSVSNKENAKKVMQGLCQDATSYQIISYSVHRHRMQMKSQSVPNIPPVPAHSTPRQTGPNPSPMTGVKRRSPSPTTDTAYPPTKLQRKSLAKETITYPSIPEEDEKTEDAKFVGVEDDNEEDIGLPVSRGDTGVAAKKEEQQQQQQQQQQQGQNEEGDEDIGLPISRGDAERKRRDGKKNSSTDNGVNNKQQSKSKPDQRDSSINFQLFEEPDTW